MALTIPTWPDPQSPTPITNAYAWIAALSIDTVAGTGSIAVWVNRSTDAANALSKPASIVLVRLGEVLATDADGKPTATFAALADIVAGAAAAQKSDSTLDPWSAFRASIYQALLSHPKFAGATLV